jgi:hypothetical protein
VLEHLPTVACDVLAVVQGRPQFVAGEQLPQQPLALDLRDGAQVVPVEVEQVESVVLDAALLAAGERRLELGEGGAAVLDAARLSPFNPHSNAEPVGTHARSRRWRNGEMTCNLIWQLF